MRRLLSSEREIECSKFAKMHSGSLIVGFRSINLFNKEPEIDLLLFDINVGMPSRVTRFFLTHTFVNRTRCPFYFCLVASVPSGVSKPKIGLPVISSISIDVIYNLAFSRAHNESMKSNALEFPGLPSNVDANENSIFIINTPCLTIDSLKIIFVNKDFDILGILHKCRADWGCEWISARPACGLGAGLAIPGDGNGTHAALSWACMTGGHFWPLLFHTNLMCSSREDGIPFLRQLCTVEVGQWTIFATALVPPKASIRSFDESSML